MEDKMDTEIKADKEKERHKMILEGKRDKRNRMISSMMNIIK